MDTNNEILVKLEAQADKIETIYQSVEKTRKYLLIIMWSSLAMIVLPLLFALLLIPMLVSTFSSYNSILQL